MWHALKRWWQKQSTRQRAVPTARRPGRSLQLEALEERLTPSWAAVPPATITPPTNPTTVTLNAIGDAAGSASILVAEIDYYSFTAPLAGSYRVAASTPTSTLDSVLAVYSAAGARLAYNNDIAAGNTDSQLTVTLGAFQRVDFGITNRDGTPGVGLAYNWLVDGPVVSDDRYENNDTRATAYDLRTLTVQQTYSNLVLGDSADWYRFTMNGYGSATAGDTVSINFTNAQGNLDLDLYDAAGTLLRSSTGTANVQSISLALRPPGVYYVRVDGAYNPAYSMTINPGADDSYEDNDSQTTAYDLGTLAAVRAVSGQLVDGADWYKFGMDGFGMASDSIDLTFLHQSGNLDLQLYDSAGTLLRSSATSTGTENLERFTLENLLPGTYWVAVVGANNPEYTLRIDPGQDDLYENNDSEAQARNLGLLRGLWSNTSLMLADSADWYCFTMEADGTGYGGVEGDNPAIRESYVQIDFQHAQGDLSLSVYTEQGEAVKEVNGIANSEKISLFDRRAGTYYVRVAGVNGARNPNYTLTISPGVDDLYENNDGLALAYDFGTLAATLSLPDLQLIDSADWYRFHMDGFGNAADRITVTYDSYEDTHIRTLGLRLYNSSGFLVAEDSHNSYPPTISLDGFGRGTYFVEVYGQMSGHYTMEIVPGRDDAYEDNDTRDKAADLGTVSPSSPIELSDLELADADDWYRIFVNYQSNSTVKVTLDFAHYKGNLDLEVYDASGVLIERSRTDRDGEEVELHDLDEGMYFIRVYSSATIDVDDGVESSARQFNPDYQLSISQQL